MSGRPDQTEPAHELFEAERALRESEERLRLSLEAGRMGAWEWMIGEGRVRWSETLERLHGLEPGTFAGTFEAYQADIHPQDRDMTTFQCVIRYSPRSSARSRGTRTISRTASSAPTARCGG